MSRTPLSRAVVTGLVATACLLAFAACAKNQAGPPTSSGTTGTGAIGNAPPPIGNSSSQPPSSPQAYPKTAEEYAKAAVAAWASRDIERLDQLEVSDGQLHTLYQCNGCYDVHFKLVGCQGAAGSSYCLFFNNVGDSLRLKLSNAALGEARAVSVGSIWDPITFPSDDKAYAQEALDAWLAGNDARLGLLTANHMTSAQISALGADKTASWAFDHSEGAAGTSYYSFADGHGHSLAFGFLNGPAAPTTGPASQHRITQIVLM